MQPTVFTYATGETVIAISEDHDHEMIICTKVPITLHHKLGLTKKGVPRCKGVDPFFMHNFLFVLTGLDAQIIESCVFEIGKGDPDSLYTNIVANHIIDDNCVAHLVEESDHGYEFYGWGENEPWDSIHMLRYVDMDTIVAAFEAYALFKYSKMAPSLTVRCKRDASYVIPSLERPPMDVLDAGDDGYGLVWFSDEGVHDFAPYRNERFKIDFPGLYIAFAFGQNNPDVCPVKFVGIPCCRERTLHNSTCDYYHDSIW